MRLDMDALPVIVSQAMQSQGLSIRAAADRCGISFSNMQAILYGRSKRPSPELLRGLEVGLGLSYRTLALAAYGWIDTEAREGALAPA